MAFTSSKEPGTLAPTRHNQLHGVAKCCATRGTAGAGGLAEGTPADFLKRDGGDAAETLMEQTQDRSIHLDDQDSSVRRKRPPVLPPGYPLRTFVLRQAEDGAEAQRPQEDDQHHGWRASRRARAAAFWSARIGVWVLVRRHGALSLCGCLALLLLSQMGAVSLLALSSRAGPNAGRDQAAFTTASVPGAPLNPTAADALSATPTQMATPTQVPTSTPTVGASARPEPSYSAATYNTDGQPCHATTFFVETVTQWAVPPDCFAKIYSPKPISYAGVHGAFGSCNWWVEVLHATSTDILTNAKYPRGSTPVPGAAIHFSPRVQGASNAGHWAQVVAVQAGSPWILVTEMNFTWRGGGFGKVDYRYVKVEPGVMFIYGGLGNPDNGVVRTKMN